MEGRYRMRKGHTDGLTGIEKHFFEWKQSGLEAAVH